jgi:hypothetical protein
MMVYLCFLERYQKIPITFLLAIHPDSVPYSISRVLRDHHQSKSKSVFKVLSLAHCVPMIITSSLFIGFESMSNDRKDDKVS